MGEVANLGYVVVSAADLAAWATFGQRVLGLELVETDESSGDNGLRFRMDERAWRFAVEPGPDNGLVALGFEVANHHLLDQLSDRLRLAGHTVTDAPALAEQRGVRTLRQVSDPTGTPLEFYCGATNARHPFLSPTGARFVTGPLGIGHAVITVDDVEKTNDFYLDFLGFRLSDTISFAGMELYFTSPCARHHNLAYSLPRPGSPVVRLQHIMLEVDDLDVVGNAQDVCLDTDVPIVVLIGKHPNDEMVSFYCVSPSGLLVEYGWGGRLVDDATHQVGHYEAAHVWGHRPTSLKNVEAELKRMAEEAKAAAGGAS